MSSKSFHPSGLPENIWFSPFVKIHFGYAACHIQSRTDGSHSSSWAHWDTVEREEILCTKGGFCVVLGSFQQQLLGVCWTSQTFPATTMLFRACSHKGVKSRPMYTQILRTDIKWAQKKRMYVWTWMQFFQNLIWCKNLAHLLLQVFIPFYQNTSQRKKITK